MISSDMTTDTLRAALLDEMTKSVEAVMIFRYHARESEETTEQARTLANAALAALDGFDTELGKQSLASEAPWTQQRLVQRWQPLPDHATSRS